MKPKTTYHVHHQRAGFAPEHEGVGLAISEAQTLAAQVAARLGAEIAAGSAHVGIYDERAKSLTITHGPQFIRSPW